MKYTFFCISSRKTEIYTLSRSQWSWSCPLASAASTCVTSLTRPRHVDLDMSHMSVCCFVSLKHNEVEDWGLALNVALFYETTTGESLQTRSTTSPCSPFKNLGWPEIISRAGFLPKKVIYHRFEFRKQIWATSHPLVLQIARVRAPSRAHTRLHTYHRFLCV